MSCSGQAQKDLGYRQLSDGSADATTNASAGFGAIAPREDERLLYCIIDEDGQRAVPARR